VRILLSIAALTSILCARPAHDASSPTHAPLGGDWSRIEAPIAVHWPRDHGAHFDVRTEWWYATGEFADGDGHRFGFQVTVFRQGLDHRPPRDGDAPLRARQALAANVALTDLGAGTLRYTERLRRLGAGLAWASETDLDVGIEDVTLRRTNSGAIAIAAGARAAGFTLELELSPEKAVVMHGATGVSRKGPEPGNASAYASFSRLAVTGRLRLRDGAAESVRAVHGAAWFDHEWGTSQLGDGVVGWDWTGLRLDDGRELMLYRLRTADGTASPFSAGTLIERDGSARSLAPEEFEFAPAADGTWRSPASGARYSLRWRVSVPSAGIRGELAARLEPCELDARASTGTIYWEGPAGLAGTVAGTGFLELAGYATSLAGDF
jgi:predicted secreted hydrolase